MAAQWAACASNSTNAVARCGRLAPKSSAESPPGPKHSSAGSTDEMPAISPSPCWPASKAQHCWPTRSTTRRSWPGRRATWRSGSTPSPDSEEFTPITTGGPAPRTRSLISVLSFDGSGSRDPHHNATVGQMTRGDQAATAIPTWPSQHQHPPGPKQVHGYFGQPPAGVLHHLHQLDVEIFDHCPVDFTHLVRRH